MVSVFLCNPNKTLFCPDFLPAAPILEWLASIFIASEKWVDTVILHIGCTGTQTELSLYITPLSIYNILNAVQININEGYGSNHPHNPSGC